MKGAVVAFNVEGIHPHDGAALLDQRGIAVRAGFHCAQPLMKRLGIAGALRASFSVLHHPGRRRAPGRGGGRPARHALAARRAAPMDPSREHPKQRDGFASPRFAQPATFMRLPHVRRPAGLDVAIVRHPLRRRRSYRSGARYGSAPRPRPVLADPAVELGSRVRPSSGCGWPTTATWTWCRSRSRRPSRPSSARWLRWWRRAAIPLCVGGDHTVTLAVLRALAKRHGRLGLVHFDAHPDTWDRVLRPALLSRQHVPAGHRGGTGRRRALHPGGHPRAALRARRLRLPRASTASR